MPQKINSCVPSPCGPNSQCRDSGGSPSCSCLLSYVGSPPNCKPECTINAECPSNLACMREKCRDPCPGSCGVSAICNVLNHTPVCSCHEGFTGDPFTMCHMKPPIGNNASLHILVGVVPVDSSHLLLSPSAPFERFKIQHAMTPAIQHRL